MQTQWLMFLPLRTLGLKLFFREVLDPGCKSLLLPRRHKQHIPSLDRAACNMMEKNLLGQSGGHWQGQKVAAAGKNCEKLSHIWVT